jgi:hypothetical protein
MLDLLLGIKNTTRSVQNVLSRVTRIMHIVLFSLIGLFILHSLYQMQHLSDMTLLLFINLPISCKRYPNADTDKVKILIDNKQKSGIYCEGARARAYVLRRGEKSPPHKTFFFRSLSRFFEICKRFQSAEVR